MSAPAHWQKCPDRASEVHFTSQRTSARHWVTFSTGYMGGRPEPAVRLSWSRAASIDAPSALNAIAPRPRRAIPAAPGWSA
jgi:hypothetical protein